MSTYQTVSIAAAEQMIGDAHVLLLDMRDHRSWLAGHHPRALHLNDMNLRMLLKQAARHIPVLIYCYHGSASQDMAQLFSDFGFTSCYSLDGGYEAWCQAITRPQTDLSEALTEWLELHDLDPDNLDLRGPNNETALMRAARAGAVAECEELIVAGAGINLKNKDGNNALWMACFSESPVIIRRLIAAGIEIDNQNDHGATALMYAAAAAKLAVVQTLVRAGANTTLVTRDDFRALDVAGNVEVLRFLRGHTPLSSARPTAVSSRLLPNTPAVPRTHHSGAARRVAV
jgi:thiosulfate/3-mercaptopyruvate sulfurtransferase